LVAMLRMVAQTGAPNKVWAFHHNSPTAAVFVPMSTMPTSLQTQGPPTAAITFTRNNNPVSNHATAGKPADRRSQHAQLRSLTLNQADPSARCARGAGQLKQTSHPSRMMVQKRQGRAIAPAPGSYQLSHTKSVRSDTLREGSSPTLERVVQGTMLQGNAGPQDAHAVGALSSFSMVRASSASDQTTAVVGLALSPFLMARACSALDGCDVAGSPITLESSRKFVSQKPSLGLDFSGGCDRLLRRVSNAPPGEGIHAVTSLGNAVPQDAHAVGALSSSRTVLMTSNELSQSALDIDGQSRSFS